MNAGATLHLLAREREELEAVVTPLKEGRRVVAFVISSAKLRPVVLAYLRERSAAAIPNPVAMTDPYEMLAALTEVAGLGTSEVRSFLIDHSVPEVLRTLNWHREKLRRGGSVIVWMDGIDGLEKLRAVAPDAYSFRDVMIVVQGAENVPVLLPASGSIDLALAQHGYASAMGAGARAEGALQVAELLHVYGANGQARSIVQTALAEIPPVTYSSQTAHITRAALYQEMRLTLEHEHAEAWRAAQAAIADLRGLTSPDARRQRLLTLAWMPSPLEVDHVSTQEALAETGPDEDPALRAHVLTSAGRSAALRGDMKRAAGLFQDVRRSHRLSDANRATVINVQGDLDRAIGNLSRAEQRYRESAMLREGAGTGTFHSALPLAKCYRLRGEIEAARDILADIRDRFGRDIVARFEVALIDTELLVDEGDVRRGLDMLRALIHEAAASFRDGHLYDASSSYVSIVEAAHDVGHLALQDLIDADADLDVAETVAHSIARDNPPWYTILYPGLRAELFALRPERLSDAITLATTALERARAVWTDAVPMHARMLVAHLVRANRLDEARAALAVAEPEAEAQRHLRELARLRAHAVAVLVRTGAPATEVEAKMAALRATLDETGAPRIVAETLLELSRLLPPDASSPEPLDLLDEAYALFVEMPYPAQEARCLEVMGDILAARNDPAAARRRYLAAKGTYERYGLGLRVPLLTSKIGDASA